MLLILFSSKLHFKPQPSRYMSSFLSAVPLHKLISTQCPFPSLLQKQCMALASYDPWGAVVLTKILTSPLWEWEGKQYCSWYTLMTEALIPFHVTYIPCKSRSSAQKTKNTSILTAFSSLLRPCIIPLHEEMFKRNASVERRKHFFLLLKTTS